jgi:tRNA 2-thiocytidine biosynthesis protein TtcA
MPAPSQSEKRLMHNMGNAIADFNMIQDGDRVLVCLSGGKDSFTMVQLLHKMRMRSGRDFHMRAFTLDQAQPGWDDSKMRAWLDRKGYEYDIMTRDTYSVVMDKIPDGKTYCSLCSRLRRGNIYGYAERHGYNKIALGHHRDDIIESILMSMLYSGRVSSMPPKLLTDNKKHVLIRPLAYCQEKDIIKYAREQQYPIIPCNLCGSQENMTRKKVKALIAELGSANPKIPGNILAALGNVKPSQLMDHELWDFKNLEQGLVPMDSDAPSEDGKLPWSANA